LQIFDRIRRVRKYRELTQDDVAKWFKISGASYGRKEKGKEGGFGPGELQIFVEKTNIDARYLFGQIDSLDRADLTLAHPTDAGKELSEIKEIIKTKIPDAIKRDNLYVALMKQGIRNIISEIKNWDETKLDMIWAFINGMKAQQHYDKSKKEKVG